MSTSFGLPLIIKSTQTDDILGLRINNPRSQFCGMTRILCADAPDAFKVNANAYVAHESGELSGYGVFDRIEHLFPKELGQLDIDPFSEVTVHWNNAIPIFTLHREPYIFSSMLLQDQLIWTTVGQLAFQDRLFARFLLSNPVAA